MSTVLAWLDSHLTFVIAVPLIAIAGIMAHSADANEQKAIALQVQLTAETHRADSLAKRVTVVDTVVRHDTVTLTKQVHVYATVHDSVLKHVTDTMQVIRYVAVADSTIHACQRVVQDCGRQVATRDTLITALRSELTTANRLTKVEKPGVLSRLGVSAGYGISDQGGKLGVGPMVGLTVRVWP